ncbi:PilZ domain-containing protein [Salinarimonas sp.]|uniref:PilZ domain-containing protein n=1 Tax=Salinarimonas sp. TaxID=2766526 RepID=UPI00391878F4
MSTTIEGESGSGVDGRVAPRHRVLIAGTIRYAGGIGTASCVVRNLSETGAKLTLSESLNLPTHFDLAIAQKNAVHRCELRWRRGEEAGVAFLDASASAPAAAPAPPIATPEIDALRARIRTLEAENARLKARIAELAGG